MTYRMKAAVAAALVSVCTPAIAQDTATAPSSVTIIQPIDITAVDSLDFGVVAAPTGTGTGTVTVSAASARSAADGVALVSGGTVGAASFTVSGDASRAFSTTFPVSGTFPLKASGQPDLTVTLIPGTVPTALDGNGTAAFTVGGTLAIPGGTTPAVYSGSFDVMVSYN